jgi:hypothetical protein
MTHDRLQRAWQGGRRELRAALGAVSWVSVAAFTLGAAFAMAMLPRLIEAVFPVENFVTNNLGTGPPTVDVTDDRLRYSDREAMEKGDKDMGTPRVWPDWLAWQTFFDKDRTVFIYEGNLLGPNVCTLEVAGAPKEGFRAREGAVQPEDGYSLDRWTGFTLRQCGLPPGNYVMVTQYWVDVLDGIGRITFTVPSDQFTILEN